MTSYFRFHHSLELLIKVCWMNVCKSVHTDLEHITKIKGTFPFSRIKGNWQYQQLHTSPPHQKKKNVSPYL